MLIKLKKNRDLSNLAFKNPGSKFFEPVTGKRKVKCPEQLDLGAVRFERKRKLF